MTNVTGTQKDDDLYIFFGGTATGLGGDDTIYYNQGEGDGFRIFGGDGNDYVRSGGDAHFLFIDGYVASPEVSERAATADLIDLGDGDDRVSAGGGNDSFVGGKGFDVLDYSETQPASGSGYLEGFHYGSRTTIIPNTGGLVINLEAGTTTFGGATVMVEVLGASGATLAEATRGSLGAFTQTFKGFEAIVGSQWRDKWTGTDRTDMIEIFDVGTLGSGDSSSRIIGRGGTDIVSYGLSVSIVADLQKRTVESNGRWISEDGTESSFTDVLAGIEGVFGSSSKDFLRGDEESNIFSGRAGDDKIDGRGGFDTVTYDTGPLGRNTVSALSDGILAVEVDLGDGTAIDDWGNTDTLISIEHVIGTSRDDTLLGGKGRNTLEGADGDDIIKGVKGTNLLLGQNGDDTITGGSGVDVIEGGKGADTLKGGNESDKISGNSGNDTLRGGKGDDILSGNADNDYLYGDKGDDTLNGGDGSDELYGDQGQDTLLGGDKNDELFGGADSDVLNGGKGNDRHFGGNGADRLEGNEGNDHYDGGNGRDVLGTAGATSGIKVDLEKGTFTGGGFGTNTIENVEIVFGTEFRDRLSGDEKSNILSGSEGKDFIYGKGGNDKLDGGNGNDTILGGDGDDIINGDRDGTSPYTKVAGRDLLKGGAGNDTIFGGGNDDRLEGGAGDDILDGGKGDDKLFGSIGKDTFVFGDGKTTATDFTVIDDVVDLRGRFSSFDEVMAAIISRPGQPVQIQDGSDLLILSGTTEDNLQDGNFIFG